MRFDVEGGGGGEDFRVPRGMREPERAARAPTRAARWDLALGDRRAWQINGRGLRPEPDRRPAAPRQHGALDRSSTRPTACTRCTCTGSCSGCSSARAGRVAAGRPARLEGHDRRAAQRDGRPCCAWFAPYGGKYVFHCHALEHADKAMMLQMEVVVRRGSRSPASRSPPSWRFAGDGRLPMSRSRPSTTSDLWSPDTVDGQGRREGHVDVRRHARSHNVEVRQRQLDASTARRPSPRRRRPRTRSRRPATYTSSASCTRTMTGTT